MNKIQSEVDVPIRTLTFKQLFEFSPPVIMKKYEIPIEQSNLLSPRNQKEKSVNIIPYGHGKTSLHQSSECEYLGVGGFSKVYKFRGDLEHKAVKKIINNPLGYSAKLTILDSVRREAFGMIKCKCKHSVEIYDIVQNEKKDIFFLLIEQCHGNLLKLVKELNRNLTSIEIKLLLKQLNIVFYQLFKNNIIHRDIKPSNILYLEEKIERIDKSLPFNGRKLTFKLTDYGVCIPLYDSKYSQSQFMGTLDFMAPEIYCKRTRKEHPIYTVKIDLFSLGQSILNLMGFIQNPKALNETTIIKLKKENPLFNGSNMDQLLADLVFNNLLVIDPEERIGWELYFLHPFFDEDGNDLN